MTVTSDDNRVTATGNGVTTAFSFSRIFYSEDHIEVYLDGVLQSSGYTVTGAGTTSGFVTFSVAPPNGTDIIMRRIVPYRQETDFENFDGNPSDVTEKQFDLVVMQTQQLAQIANRSITVPVNDTATDLELPDVATRAGGVLIFDGNGNVDVTTDADSVSAGVAAAAAAAAEAAQTAAEAAQAAAEAAAVGIKWRPQVKAATTANITLSGAQTIDGIALVAGDRCLVKDQSTAANNGIYIVAAGSWSRATDADSWSALVSLAVSVEQGSSNADTQWICTADTGGTLGVTAVTFAPFLTTPKDASVTYAKIDPNAVATSAEIRSGAASKLVDAATLASVNYVVGTEQASTSGTSIDFTGIPANVNRIIVHFLGVSTSSTSNWIAQIGDSGGVETSGYVSNGSRPNTASTTSTAGCLLIVSPVGSETATGRCVIERIGTNKWSMNASINMSGPNGVATGSAYKTLSDTLDRVRITTAGGSDTFDAGSINITYE